MDRICIVGAGFSGAVLARELAECDIPTLVIDERAHVAGNCHTKTDPETNISVHVYGPHIFHTGHEHVWKYIRRFGAMKPYVHRVKANARGKIYSLPVNLHTINQLFSQAMSPEQARAFIAANSRQDIDSPGDFEEQALKFIGDDLYKAFFYGYTRKQWGVEPKELPAEILKRLPVRFSYDDNYFSHPYQGMPESGYTPFIENILDHRLIEVRLGFRLEDLTETFRHLFYTGPIDRYFEYKLGRLPYRTLDFETIRTSESDYQGTAVLNYCDFEVPYTRVTEHKHFAPWRIGETTGSICYREYSREHRNGDIEYYPVRFAKDKDLLLRYVDLAEAANDVTFMGRLGTYQYLDMDETIHRALETAAAAMKCIRDGTPIPVFIHRPT